MILFETKSQFIIKEDGADKINAANKYYFYTLVGDIICSEMNEDGDLLQAMINVLDELESRTKVDFND